MTVRARFPRVAFALALALGAAACTALPIVPVQPWQKGDLARPEMMFNANALEMGLSEQVYTSREASSGGIGVGGSGCGCN